MPATALAHPLDRADCLRLLATRSIGRIGFTAHFLPIIQPVSYIVDDDEIVFRVVEDGYLVSALAGEVVAFEVDDVTSEQRTGWTVLGVGETATIVDPAHLAALAPRLPEPWSAGQRSESMILSLELLTGHRFLPAPTRAGTAASARPAESVRTRWVP